MGRTLIGKVSSNKGDKTIVVNVVAHKTHPLYKKQYTFSKNYMAHDETNDAEVGDKVSITETRPLSARKRFKLEKIIERAAIEHVKPEPAAIKETESADETIAKTAKVKKAVEDES